MKRQKNGSWIHLNKVLSQHCWLLLFFDREYKSTSLTNKKKTQTEKIPTFLHQNEISHQLSDMLAKHIRPDSSLGLSSRKFLLIVFEGLQWNLDFINNTLYYINCEIMYADLYGDCIDGCFDGWLRVQSSRLLLVVYFDTSLQLEVITYNWSIDKMRILVCKTMC